MQGVASVLNQRILEESSNPHRITKSSSSSFTVRDILQWPSSVNATAEDLVSISEKQSSSTSSEMLTHDLFPQNRMRPMSISGYPPEERYCADRYPQFLDSRSQSSADGRFSFSHESSHSMNGILHHDTDPRTSEVFSPEKRHQGVESPQETSESASPILNMPNHSAFSGSIQNKATENSLFQKNCLENSSFASTMSNKAEYGDNMKFPQQKEKYDPFANEGVTSEFHEREAIRKSDNEVFLPDDNLSSVTSQSEWPKIEDKIDVRLQGKKIIIFVMYRKEFLHA